MRGLKSVLIFSSIVAVCIGLFSGVISVMHLCFDDQEMISLQVHIIEYKIVEDSIELFIDDSKNKFYVDNVSVPQFKKEDFEETYSKEGEYLLTVKKSDYDRFKEGNSCQLYGVTDGKEVFLDIKEVQKAQNMNAILGLMISGGMFASAIFLLYVIKSGKYKELK